MRDRIIVTLVFVVVLVLVAVNGCNRAAIDPVKCEPYSGSDTATYRVTDWDGPHIMPHKETYWTFRYDHAATTQPSCLPPDSGKICKCDIVSWNYDGTCDGTQTGQAVVKMTIRQGSILGIADTCPDRNNVQTER